VRFLQKTVSDGVCVVIEEQQAQPYGCVRFDYREINRSSMMHEKTISSVEKELLREIEREISQVINRAMTLTICFFYSKEPRARRNALDARFSLLFLLLLIIISLVALARVHLLD
jgi:hypothetical protein